MGSREMFENHAHAKRKRYKKMGGHFRIASGYAVGVAKLQLQQLPCKADAKMVHKQIPPHHAHPVQQKWQQP